MNLTDYLFGIHKHNEKKLILGTQESISYRDAYKIIEDISEALAKKYEKGEKILLLSDNSVFFVCAYFGIIKAGCICVPVDTKITEKHMKYILDTCGIKSIYVQEKYLEKIDLDKYETITEKTIPSGFKNMTRIDTDDNDDAVIMFTSGSTGTPKGVILSHKNIIHNTESIISYLNLTSLDIMETVLPFFYCYGTSLLHTHIRVGGSLVLNNRFMFPSTVISDINEYGCTGFAGVPSTFQIILRMTRFEETPMPSLRYVTQAGGKLADHFICKLKEALGDKKIYIMYGQTEATARLSYLPPEDFEKKQGSVGKGLDGTKLYIVDENGKKVAPGDVGEIVAEGNNVMKGYFNDENETNKKIRDKVLYTGDLGYYDEEGYIYIVGREKNMIKSGGKRISSAEIEHAISEVEDVLEVAVVPIPDDILGEAIKAYVVLRDNNDKIKDEIMTKIKNNLNIKLEDFKRPKEIKFIEELPKNSSGKIMFGKLQGE